MSWPTTPEQWHYIASAMHTFMLIYIMFSVKDLRRKP